MPRRWRSRHGPRLRVGRGDVRAVHEPCGASPRRRCSERRAGRALAAPRAGRGPSRRAPPAFPDAGNAILLGTDSSGKASTCRDARCARSFSRSCSSRCLRNPSRRPDSSDSPSRARTASRDISFRTPRLLKQGFGRLIRSRSDTGVVVLLDSRVITKRYGPQVLNACRGLIVRWAPGRRSSPAAKTSSRDMASERAYEHAVADEDRVHRTQLCGACEGAGE